VLADVEPQRALGPALALARQVAADEPLHLLVDGAGGLLARRASQFRVVPTVWVVEGARLVAAGPEPLPVPPPLDPRTAPFADVLTAAGADPVVEHGRLIGEVEGLEVARVTILDGEPRLEVGVGRFDREAHALLSAGQPTDATLRQVVELVRRHRTGGGEGHHPLNLLAAARRLRAQLVRAPGLVGADHLVPMAPVVEAPDLRTPWPAPATGLDPDGRPVVVVCSVGVDLDLVPAAADSRLAAFPAGGARLVLAVPQRDRHPVTLALAGMLAEPAGVVGIA